MHFKRPSKLQHHQCKIIYIQEIETPGSTLKLAKDKWSGHVFTDKSDASCPFRANPIDLRFLYSALPVDGISIARLRELAAPLHTVSCRQCHLGEYQQGYGTAQNKAARECGHGCRQCHPKREVSVALLQFPYLLKGTRNIPFLCYSHALPPSLVTITGDMA